MSLNSGVEGIRESVYTKCKGETERGGKLSAPLYKACYDHRMKIKRGRQILSAAQENPDGWLNKMQKNEYEVLVKHAARTKPVLKMTVQHSMLEIDP